MIINWMVGYIIRKCNGLSEVCNNAVFFPLANVRLLQHFSRYIVNLKTTWFIFCLMGQCYHLAYILGLFINTRTLHGKTKIVKYDVMKCPRFWCLLKLVYFLLMRFLHSCPPNFNIYDTCCSFLISSYSWLHLLWLCHLIQLCTIERKEFSLLTKFTKISYTFPSNNLYCNILDFFFQVSVTDSVTRGWR